MKNDYQHSNKKISSLSSGFHLLKVNLSRVTLVNDRKVQI